MANKDMVRVRVMAKAKAKAMDSNPIVAKVIASSKVMEVTKGHPLEGVLEVPQGDTTHPHLEWAQIYGSGFRYGQCVCNAGDSIRVN